jgi:E3 ubiquitin-protein ligase TRIP12
MMADSKVESNHMSPHVNFGYRKRTHILHVIGQFAAKAMLDSRIIDLTFNKVFLKLVLGEDVPLTVSTLKVEIHFLSAIIGSNSLQLIDVELANSLMQVQAIAMEQKMIPKDKVSCLSMTRRQVHKDPFSSLRRLQG